MTASRIRKAHMILIEKRFNAFSKKVSTSKSMSYHLKYRD